MTCRLPAAICLLLGCAAYAWAQTPVATHAASFGGWHNVAQIVIHPVATLLLLVVGCFLLFVDMLTPRTWEITGTGGVLAVGLVFAAHVSERTGGWLGIVLMLSGVLLLLLETHVVPGHGVAAIAGLLLLFLGMFSALGGAAHAAFALPIAAVLTLVALIAFFAYLPKSPMWKQIGREMRGRTALTGADPANRAALLGRTGIAITALRPSGIAEFGGARVQVVTEGDFLASESPLVVTAVEGARVVVERVGETVAVGGTA